MATVTTTLTPFKKSLQAALATSANYLQGTLTLAVLDNATPVTEDTSVTGDEFLDELGGVILSSWAVASPTLTGLLLDGDDTGSAELTDIGSGEVGNKVILYDNTGVAATSRLWAIGTLSSNITGDTVDDDIQFGSGFINFDG